MTPCPGSRTVAQQIAQTSARPTAGDEPGPAPHAAERQRRLPDRQRGDADRQHRCVGPDHKAASLEDRPESKAGTGSATNT